MGEIGIGVGHVWEYGMEWTGWPNLLEWSGFPILKGIRIGFRTGTSTVQFVTDTVKYKYNYLHNVGKQYENQTNKYK